MKHGTRIVVGALSVVVAGGVAYLVQTALIAKRVKAEGVTLELPLVGAQHVALDGGSGGGGSSLVLPADAVAMQKRAPWIAAGVAGAAGLAAVLLVSS